MSQPQTEASLEFLSDQRSQELLIAQLRASGAKSVVMTYSAPAVFSGSGVEDCEIVLADRFSLQFADQQQKIEEVLEDWALKFIADQHPDAQSGEDAEGRIFIDVDTGRVDLTIAQNCTQAGEVKEAHFVANDSEHSVLAAGRQALASLEIRYVMLAYSGLKGHGQVDLMTYGRLIEEHVDTSDQSGPMITGCEGVTARIKLAMEKTGTSTASFQVALHDIIDQRFGEYLHGDGGSGWLILDVESGAFRHGQRLRGRSCEYRKQCFGSTYEFEMARARVHSGQQ